MKGDWVACSVQIADEPRWVVVRVRGDLDLAAAPRVRAALASALMAGGTEADVVAGAAPRPGLAVDLGAVDFVDSTGIGVLIGGLRRARQRALPFVLVATPDPVLELFELVGLDRLFDCVGSLEHARATLGNGQAER